jgi:hypothetical protein
VTTGRVPLARIGGNSQGTNPEDGLVPPRYEICVAGRLDEAAGRALAGLDVSTRGAVTIIAGEFDQAALHGLLERIRSLGLDLLEARRIHGSARIHPRDGRKESR